jgi:hypothetical protein
MWHPLAAAAPQQQADGPGTTYANSMAVTGVHVPLSMAVSSLSWAHWACVWEGVAAPGQQQQVAAASGRHTHRNCIGSTERVCHSREG